MIQTIPSKFNQFPVYYNNGGSLEPPTPPDYSTLPLTFKSTGSTSVKLYSDLDLANKTFSGQIDDGAVTTVTVNKYSDSSAFNLSDGQELKVWGNMDQDTKQNGMVHIKFKTSGDGTLQVYGNLLSLSNWNDAGGGKYRWFQTLHGLTNLTDASNLVIPTPTVRQQYQQFFGSCTALTAVPVLPTYTAGVAEQYVFMFYGCTALNKIEVDFTSWTDGAGGLGDFYYWVNGVSPTGTFVKPTALSTVWANSSNSWEGIPQGWTVIDK